MAPPTTKGTDEPWYRRHFGPRYLSLYPHRDLDEARRLTRALAARGLAGRGPVADLGCGPGRHLAALAEVGVAAVGVDLSAPLLEEARRQLALAGGEAAGRASRSLVRADVRALPLAGATFSLAMSLFTSFGYFEDAEDDLRALAEAARIVRDDGVFLLDFLNARLTAAQDGRETTHALPDARVRELRRLTPDRRRIVKEIEVRSTLDGAVTERLEERVTLYRREELSAALGRCGLAVSEVWGDYEGEAFDEARSPRLILLARKERDVRS